MPRTPDEPFHVGLTPDRIIDVATELTRRSHLWGWSIRDLTRELNVAPSVVYHHIGGKDRIARGVVERVLAQVVPPDPDLHWEAWFSQILSDLYPLIAGCPGSAKWLMMHGPSFPAVLPVVEAGVRTLVRAGFGDRAGMAYSLLLNNAMLTISVADDRLVHADDGPRDHAAMMVEFARYGADSPELALITHGMLDPLIAGGTDADHTRRAYYDFVITTSLAGLRAQLEV